jgi:hypothetical protein
MYLFGRKNKSNVSDVDKTNDTSKSHQTKENPYDGLRNLAFGATPEILGLKLSSDKTLVYGIIMDWQLSGAIVTTAAYQTGDASIYLSSGGGFIGGVQHSNVSDAAKLFVRKAQDYLGKATKTEKTPLPKKGIILFYLLTNKGIYVGTEEMTNVENGTSSWAALFEEGNKVISEYRLISEKHK